jgi:hypothetical protein
MSMNCHELFMNIYQPMFMFYVYYVTLSFIFYLLCLLFTLSFIYSERIGFSLLAD